MIGRVSSYQWALLFHLAGAFLYIGGIILQETTWFRVRRGTSSTEIRTLLDLSKLGETIAAVGALVLFGFAFWLVDLTPYGFGDAWVVVALTLFVLQGIPFNIVSKQRKRARAISQALAEDASAPSPELDQLLRSPRLTALAHLSSLIAATILVLMVWKPGA